MASVFDGFTTRQKRALAVFLIGGGLSLRALKQQLRAARREQQAICQGVEAHTKRTNAPKVAVDAVFARRLLAILKICVPSVLSPEAGLIYAQGALLVLRTLLSDYVSKLEGRAARWAIQSNAALLSRTLGQFVAVSIPAAVVNSGLKYMQRRIKLAFQRRLTQSLHAQYCEHRAYYAASTLGGLTHADQRITEDVERFSHTISELYSYTFKPLLDVILFTRSLSRVMGYKRQFALYGYYLLAAQVLRAASPPLALMTAQETALGGSFRAAHQRLVAHAEEVAVSACLPLPSCTGGVDLLVLVRPAACCLAVLASLECQPLTPPIWLLLPASNLIPPPPCPALPCPAPPCPCNKQFNDPPAGMSEQMILNQHLYRLLRHSRLSAFMQFVQQSLDGFLIKYGATSVALAIYSLPLFWQGGAGLKEGSQGEVTQNYISSMRLLSNTSKGIGELVLVYKRVTGLAGHTSRVSELLERIRGLSRADEEDTLRRLYLRNVSSSGLLLPASVSSGALPEPLPEPRRLEGETIKFNRVYLASPDGAELVRELSFEVQPGRSVLIMGPNGSGKSSLFRVAAGLWPLQAGEVTLPPKGELFYLSQRPYLVAGTLRDQLLYPEPPQAVWAASKSERTRARVEPWMKSLAMGEDELEERLSECLEAVELDYLLIRGRGWDQVQPWNETLSGGEKQRLAAARLLFHRPKFAILDECTSAVSADGESKLYLALVRAGITCVSIGHRPALRRFHSVAVHFGEGGHLGPGHYAIEQLRGSDVEGLTEADLPGVQHQA
ncbi:hypothetical protein ABPG75_007999 [Micractinium tetrahymenae]